MPKQEYQKVSTNVDHTDQSNNIPSTMEPSEPRARLPLTQSSQQLMTPDTESVSTSLDRDNEAYFKTEFTSTPSRNLFGFNGISSREWFTVGVLCFVNLINYMDRFTIAGVLNDIQKYYDIRDDQGGLLQTAFVLSYMICAPIFGYLGDRYSRRWIMMLGVALWSATTLLGSYMNSYGWFLTFRALVGIGEASYSTIAPTIISDLFVHDVRSKMLAIFYFAIPVGSGFGYIVGSETAKAFNSWQWALRVTPILGAIAVVLIYMTKEPERGQSENSHNLQVTSYREDLSALVKNPSFMHSTVGLTCVAFVAGALAWWGPTFILYGLVLQPGNENLTLNEISYKFGIIAMISGLIGVPLGSFLAQRLRPTKPSCDPVICAWGLFISAPFVYFAMITAKYSLTWCLTFVFLAELFLNLCCVSFKFGAISMVSGIIGVPLGSYLSQILIKRFPRIDPILCAIGLILSAPLFAGAMILVSASATAAYVIVFFGQLALNLNWAIVADILLYVVVPTRRSTAEAFQILISHAFGDAGSPYIVGVISETLKGVLTDQSTGYIHNDITNSTMIVNNVSPLVKFRSLQYALFSTCFVEIIGGVFFLITSIYILKDKDKAQRAVTDTQDTTAPRQFIDENSDTS